MADVESTPTSSSELLGVGRRHLAVKDYNSAVEYLARACEQLAKEHGETGDQCAEAYLWYGKALLGLSREESGVLGDGMPGADTTVGEEDDEENDEDNAESEENEECAGQEDGASEENGESKENGASKENGELKETDELKESNEQFDIQKKEATSHASESTSAVESDAEKASISSVQAVDGSVVDLENEDENVDNLQLAWEMLELARSILTQRQASKSDSAARTLLADTYLALGEVGLESETYDEAVNDMIHGLEIQKELYECDDRRIAETHFKLGLANSLASNFEDAINHFKDALEIIESRVKTLENPSAEPANAPADQSTEVEIKELKELIPEIQEKIQDMMDYKAETIKRVRDTLCPTNGQTSTRTQDGAGSSAQTPKAAPSDISHLIKRKRKSSGGDSEATAAKKPAS